MRPCAYAESPGSYEARRVVLAAGEENMHEHLSTAFSLQGVLTDQAVLPIQA